MVQDDVVEFDKCGSMTRKNFRLTLSCRLLICLHVRYANENSVSRYAPTVKVRVGSDVHAMRSTRSVLAKL